MRLERTLLCRKEFHCEKREFCRKNLGSVGLWFHEAYVPYKPTELHSSIKMVNFTYAILPQCNSIPTTLTVIFLSNLQVLVLLKILLL